MSKIRAVEFNKLPNIISSIGNLISKDSSPIKPKNEKEIKREFQHEKWKNLLKKIKNTKDLSLHNIEKIQNDNLLKTAFYFKNRFYLSDNTRIHQEHIKLYSEFLKPYIKSASCLIEFGAGYGSKILGLSQNTEFSKLSLYAGEYTQAGCSCIKILAKALKANVNVGFCDFINCESDFKKIPPNGIIFTSYAAHYIPQIPRNFADFLLSFEPKIIINFEPVYELLDKKTIHGLLCRKYMEQNDYSKNLFSIVKKNCTKKNLSLKVTKNVISSNPFLPISVLEWGQRLK